MPRRLGQHFLNDRTVLNKIVRSLELDRSSHVLEIGPGQGVLTRQLAASAGRVTAIELDGALAGKLEMEFNGDRVRIVHGNALSVDPCLLMPADYKLAGNIPYYITGALLRKFLTSRCKPSMAVLMVQLEVAQRMLAAPGEMSLLALSTQLFCEGALVTRVHPGSFSPPPKVESAVVKLVVLPQPRVAIPDEERFFAVARAGFGTRRKQLANALAQGLAIAKPEAKSMLDQAGVDGALRAEDLTLEEWGRLAQAVSPDEKGLGAVSNNRASGQ